MRKKDGNFDVLCFTCKAKKTFKLINEMHTLKLQYYCLEEDKGFGKQVMGRKPTKRATTNSKMQKTRFSVSLWQYTKKVNCGGRPENPPSYLYSNLPV
jgi:hypothetical protein